MKIHACACLLAISCLLPAAHQVNADDNAPADADLAKDLKNLQGIWELMHGNEGKGAPTIRSLKIVEGNTETIRRFKTSTGELVHEHSVEFQLSKSGNVRVLTFYRVGGSPEQGASYVYKLDGDDFWDIPGLLHGKEYRNYQPKPTIWHWHRITGAPEDGGVPAQN